MARPGPRPVLVAPTGVAEVVDRVLLEGHEREFRMQAWVIMPNHVHLVAEVWHVSLVHLVNGWKGKSSRLANLLLQRHGAFWQVDYFDTVIRDQDHLAKATRYTEQNPNKAALVKVPRDWPWSSAHRRDAYGRLLWPRDRDC